MFRGFNLQYLKKKNNQGRIPENKVQSWVSPAFVGLMTDYG